nr:ADP-ribosylglycohydrolase family protein [Olsenella sp. An290]
MVHVMRALAAGASPAEAVPDFDVLLAASEKDLGSGGFVRDTYCAALWCLVVSESYEECVLRAVNLGDDTDTTAAVAGALAGIVYGADAIPAAWMEALRGKDIIEACLF